MDANTKKKIDKVKTYLAVKHPFFGVLLGMLDFYEDNSVGTMGTDGSRLVYSKTFTQELSEEELRWVLLHELMHIAYLHCGNTRMLDRDPRKWNYACDYVINLELDEVCRNDEYNNYKPPANIKPLMDQRFKGKISERVYREIPDHMKMMFAVGKGTCPKCGGTGQKEEKCDECYGTGSIDQECSQCGGSGKDKDGNTCPHCDGRGEEKTQCPKCGGSGNTGRKEPCECGGQGGEGFYYGDLIRPKSSEDIDEMKDKIIQAFEVTKVKNQGYLPAGLRRAIERMKKAKVPWQRIFQRFVGNALAKDDYSWTNPRKSLLAQGIIMPSMRNHIVGSVVVATDTSGSINHEQLGQFAAEMKKMSWLVSEITAITCDADVHEVVKIYQMEEFLTKLQFKGGGGTDFRPVFKYVEDKKIAPELLIYLTDSYGSFPDRPPKYPVIWVLTEEGLEDRIPWGLRTSIPGGRKARERGF